MNQATLDTAAKNIEGAIITGMALASVAAPGVAAIQPIATAIMDGAAKLASWMNTLVEQGKMTPGEQALILKQYENLRDHLDDAFDGPNWKVEPEN